MTCFPFLVYNTTVGFSVELQSPKLESWAVIFKIYLTFNLYSNLAGSIERVAPLAKGLSNQERVTKTKAWQDTHHEVLIIRQLWHLKQSLQHKREGAYGQINTKNWSANLYQQNIRAMGNVAMLPPISRGKHSFHLRVKTTKEAINQLWCHLCQHPRKIKAIANYNEKFPCMSISRLWKILLSADE